MSVSNGSLEDEDCSDITDWADQDKGVGVSDQTSVNGKEVFRFDTNASAVSDDYAKRTKDSGSVNALGNRITVSLSLYLAAVGTFANNDYFKVTVQRSDWRLGIIFASNGLFIETASGSPEVSTDLPQTGVWQDWTFDVDLSAGVASATCDVYLDNVLQVSNVSCNKTGSYTDGETYIYLIGYTTDNRIAYLDWYKVGNGLSWSGKLNGITNPTKIMGINTANISKVMGV